MDPFVVTYLVSGMGMVVVGAAAALLWWWISRAEFRWFAVGVGLWVVAVAIKVVIALLTNAPVVKFLETHLPHGLYVTLGGLYVGLESSLCEIGLTLLLVLLWRAPGRDAGTATAVGAGAGAFEAMLLGVSAVAAGLVFGFVDHPEVAKAAEAAGKIQDTTQLAWLIGTAERVLAILCHMSSRTLVLLGVTRRRIGMVVGGFVLFTYIDSVAGAAHISGNIGKFSLWWIELAIVPAALASLVILHWCWRTWGRPEPAPSAPAAHADEHTPNDVHGENA